MQLNITRYAHLLEGLDMAEESKVAVLEQVWAICSSFVERAWGEAPEQKLLGIRRASHAAHVTAPGGDRLDSTPHIHSTFNDAASDARAESESP